MIDGFDPRLVTVVVAARNEARTIEQVVRRCAPFASTVVVVDGQSTDGTPGLAAEAGAMVIAQVRPLGKGAALRQAIAAVSTPIVVFIDADGSHVPEDIPALVKPIIDDQADHVSASRLRGGSSELHGGFDEFFRLTGSSLITACINWRFGVRLSESQNGFRSIRTALVNDLGLRENSTTVEQEMIIKTLRLRKRMAEVASHEHPRTCGQSHIRLWRAAPRYVYSLVRYGLFR